MIGRHTAVRTTESRPVVVGRHNGETDRHTAERARDSRHRCWHSARMMRPDRDDVNGDGHATDAPLRHTEAPRHRALYSGSFSVPQCLCVSDREPSAVDLSVHLFQRSPRRARGKERDVDHHDPQRRRHDHEHRTGAPVCENREQHERHRRTRQPAQPVARSRPRLP